jgi:hypothetical protein
MAAWRAPCVRCSRCARPTVPAAAAPLRNGGLTQLGDRMLAVRGPGGCATGTGPLVMESDDAQPFVELLLAGCQVDGAVAAFIAAERSSRSVRRYLAVANRSPRRR